MFGPAGAGDHAGDVRPGGGRGHGVHRRQIGLQPDDLAGENGDSPVGDAPAQAIGRRAVDYVQRQLQQAEPGDRQRRPNSASMIAGAVIVA